MVFEKIEKIFHMRVDFLQTADDEFAEAIAYYNLQSEGLGLEFAAEVKIGGQLRRRERITSKEHPTRPPARVCQDTGEQYFAPETVEHIQTLIKSRKKPAKTIETPVFEYA